MPFAFLVSLLACTILASTIGQFSKVAPSAGAFYTFSSKGFGPRTGFLTGWLIFLGYSVLEPAELAIIGAMLSEFLKTYLNIDIHWAVIAVLGWILVFALSWFGAKQSMKLSFFLFLAEVAVLFVLCAIVLGKGGAEGIHFKTLTPALSPTGFSGIALGMIYGIMSFIGFEAATTLAEEVRDARKNVYIALVGSTVFVGIIYLLTTFSLVNGFGLEHMETLVAASSPVLQMAADYGGSTLVAFMVLAGAAGILAVTVNVHNAVARIIYVMGREEILPAALGKVHPKYHTPSNALILQSIISIVLLFAMGFSVGPSNTYGYLGAIMTLGIIPVYMLAAIGYIRYQKKQGSLADNPFRNVVLPLVASMIMLVPLSGSFYPVPPAPYNFFPYIMLAYVIIGYLIIQHLGREPGRLERVGMILADAEQESA